MGLMMCPRGQCLHPELVHDWDEPGVDPVCCVEGCPCGKRSDECNKKPPQGVHIPGAGTSQMQTDIRGEGVIPDQYDHGHPIRSVDTPPAEPAVQPASPPHYAGHTPGYGPNPTAQGVRGYRDLPADDVTLINAVKELQENVANVWAAVYVRPGTDTRWADIARLHLEEGVSALVRSVAKPHDPFRSALDNLRADAEQRAREAIERDLARSKMDAPERPSGESTVEQDPAQQSHDHRPDEGSHA